jgi:hypothetical protein
VWKPQNGRAAHSFGWCTGEASLERCLYFDDAAFQADHGGMGPVLGT